MADTSARVVTKGQHLYTWHILYSCSAAHAYCNRTCSSCKSTAWVYAYAILLIKASYLLAYNFLVSSRYENVEDKVESADSAMTGLAQLTLGAPPPHCRDPLKDTPLAELLFPALPNSLHASPEVQDVLLVLKILECLNR